MLAIVIPYYKHSFFEATLQSLANQTDKRFHVYIGDDASPENPEALLKNFKNTFKYQYKKFDSNLGGTSLIKQWERCLDMVKNEKWVMILGDDDTLSPHVVASFYENIVFIEKIKTSVIRFATQVIDQNGTAMSKVYQHPILEKATDFLMRKYKGGTRSSLSEFIFESDKVATIKFKDFPMAWSSDTLAIVEFSNNIDIYTINNALVFFRLSGKNITSQGDSKEKNNAWFQFYFYVLSNYGRTYPKELVQTLFDKLEKSQLNNKKTPLRWIKLFWLYIAFSQYSRFISLVVKIKKSIK